MADSFSIDSEKTPASKSEMPSPGAETSSDDATSTKSSELKTPDDVDTLISLPSLDTPVRQGCKGENSSGSQSPLCSTTDDTSEGMEGVHRGDPSEDDALLHRRRATEPSQDDADRIQELENSAAEPFSPTDDTARRSRRVTFLSSLSQTLENSNHIVVNFFYGWQAYSIFLSDTRYLMPVQMIFMAVSLSAVCTGQEKLEACSVAPSLPILMIVLGTMGMFTMILRMIYVNLSYVDEGVEVCVRVLRKIIFLMNLIYFITLCVEFSINQSISPSSDDSASDNYCDPGLRKYILIYNCAAFTFTLLSLALHFPAYLFNSWKIGGPGFPDNRA